MPTFSEMAVIKQSNKAKRSWNPFKPFNDLTAKMAEKQAKEDIRKEQELKSKKK